MKDCWNDDKESRPNFLELKDTFDGFIAHEERYNYLQPLGSVLEAAEKGSAPAEQVFDPAQEGFDPAEEGLHDVPILQVPSV